MVNYEGMCFIQSADYKKTDTAIAVIVAIDSNCKS